MNTVQLPMRVGRLAERRFQFALLRLRAEYIDIRAELVHKGLLDRIYLVTVTGTARNGRRVDEVLGRVGATKE